MEVTTETKADMSDFDSSVSESDLDIDALFGGDESKAEFFRNYRQLLESWNLSKYASNFENAGWTDVREWPDMTQSDLEHQVGLKPKQVEQFLRHHKIWLPQRLALLQEAKQKYEEQNRPNAKHELGSESNNNANNSNNDPIASNGNVGKDGNAASKRLNPPEAKLNDDIDPSPNLLDPSLRNDFRMCAYENDFEGICYNLGTHFGDIKFCNPAEHNEINITTSELAAESDSGFDMVGEGVKGIITVSNVKYPWFAVDFKEKFVKPTHYTLRHYAKDSKNCLRNWQLEGSIDGYHWTTILYHTNDTSLKGKNGSHTWQVDCEQYFCQFRILMNGINSSKRWTLVCSGFEMYGELRGLSGKGDVTKPREISTSYEYSYDFDENGVCYALGTDFHENAWENPHLKGLLKVRAREILPGSHSEEAIVGRSVVRCLLNDNPNSWFIIDFTPLMVRPNYYSLKHYASWDIECLRNWELQASNDGKHWTVLREHSIDKSLTGRGGTASWPLPDVNEFYSQFRVYMTGRNDNDHWFLACSGFEIYGDIKGISALYPELRYTTHTGPRSLGYCYDFDRNGVIYQLGTKFGLQQFENPMLLGSVSVRMKPELIENSAGQHFLLGRDSVRLGCKSNYALTKQEPYIIIDFGGIQVCPTHYSLRHYVSWDIECLRNWNFEGSNDGVQWDILLAHTNDTNLSGRGSTHTWQIAPDCTRLYSKFRIIMTDVNDNDHWYLCCSGFEIYGTILGYEPYVSMSDSVTARALEMPDDAGQKFVYKSDMDKNGVLYWLGCDKGRETTWKNPAEKDRNHVSVTSSTLLEDSAAISSVVGREAVRCVTDSKPDQWYVIDLKDNYVIPTHYTLRHYSSWDTEALRNWYFEASDSSRYGTKDEWVTLRIHKHDGSLDAKGKAHTWQLNVRNNRAYNRFRVFQYGVNSNGQFYLPLSGFELYGTVVGPMWNVENSIISDVFGNQISSIALPAYAKPDDVEVKEFVHKGNEENKNEMDTNGLLYYLGTKGKTQSWSNPADASIVHCSSSDLAHDSETIHSLVGREACRLLTNVTDMSENGGCPDMCVDLRDVKLCVTHYSLRHYISFNTEALRNWNLEGSNDGRTWYVLSRHVNDKVLEHAGELHTWDIKKHHGYLRSRMFFSMFRIILTGKNSENHHLIACAGIELYGTAFGGIVSLPPVRSKAPEPIGLKKEFVYEHDGDENGLLYYLGTYGNTRDKWANPAIVDIIGTSSSSIYNDSERLACWISRKPSRVLTKDEPNSDMTLDLRKVRLLPSKYTLRHYSTYNDECLRNWNFEGSNDSQNWVILKEHRNDTSLQRKNQFYSWSLECDEYFRFFRIIMKGVNSNNKHQLCCGQIELYGTAAGGMVSKPPVYRRKADPPPGEFGYKNFEYDEIGKNYGLLYYLGCRADPVRQRWANPALACVVQVNSATLDAKHSQGCEHFVSKMFDDSKMSKCASKTFKTSSQISTEDAKVANEEEEEDMQHVPAPGDVNRVDAGVCYRVLTMEADTNDICVCLKQVRCRPTHYSLRHTTQDATKILRNWDLEASHDGSSWKVISSHKNDTSLQRRGQICTWPISEGNTANEFFEHFRIIMTGKNSSNTNHLSCAGFEIFGKCAGGMLSDPKHKFLERGKPPPGPYLRFKYVPGSELMNGDKHGLFYWLGCDYGRKFKGFATDTNANANDSNVSNNDNNNSNASQTTDAIQTTQNSSNASDDAKDASDEAQTGQERPETKVEDEDEWKNPCLIHRLRLKADASMLDGSNGSEPSVEAYHMVGREAVRCVTKDDKKNPWVVLTLPDKLRFCVTHYSLRHYSSWDSEALRNWRFEGKSSKTSLWNVLSVHTNDKSLDKAGKSVTWSVDCPEFCYKFSLMMTGLNSNNHAFMALSGIELYGYLGCDDARLRESIINTSHNKQHYQTLPREADLPANLRYEPFEKYADPNGSKPDFDTKDMNFEDEREDIRFGPQARVGGRNERKDDDVTDAVRPLQADSFRKMPVVAMGLSRGNITTSGTVESGIEIKGTSNFPTFRANFYLLLGYKWYYEIILNTNGIMQLGFGTNKMSSDDASGSGIDTGVGDDSNSWAVDGNRRKKWHNGDEEDWLVVPLQKWRVNDVVTLVFDCVDKNKCCIECYINGMTSVPGSAKGVVFDRINLANMAGVKNVFPAITLDSNEQVTVVFDEQYMQFPMSRQDGYRPINARNYFKQKFF